MDTFEELPNANRFEVIDHRSSNKTHNARALTVYGASISISVQDGGKTLKVFLNDPPSS